MTDRRAPAGSGDAAADGTTFALSSDNACEFLRRTGRLAEGEACSAVRLGGGVSNEVQLVHSPRGRWVVKQALPRLRVASEWLADAGRNAVEARALDLLGLLLPEGAVPNLVFVDRSHHVLAMTAASPDARNLKEMLLAGEVDAGACARAGALLGRLQAATRGRADVAEGFGDLEPFRQLRVDPYYEEVARRHGELAGPVRGWAAAATAPGRCLVHGDYSPKNMLVRGGELVLLDFEVAHWGCRGFDPAFFCNHLALKSVHLPRSAPALREAAAGFWTAYLGAAGWDDPGALEAEVVGHLGCLLVARVDGKSPAEYLRDEGERGAVRRLGRAVLARRLAGVDDVLAAAGAL